MGSLDLLVTSIKLQQLAQSATLVFLEEQRQDIFSNVPAAEMSTASSVH